MKDGTYEMKHTQTYTETSSTTTYDGKGTWAWISGNKEDEFKNKERICFTTTSSTETDSYTGGSDTDIYSGEGDLGVSTMRIDELSSKTLVISAEYTSNYDGNIYTVSETSTYEKQ